MRKNPSHTKNLSLLTLSVLALLLVGANEAAAKVRVKATVRTPYGSVRIDNSHGPRIVTPRRQVEVRITRQDKKIAKRLARYTGVSKREILRLKRQGYRWGEIARWLDVSRQVVHAAKHQQSWQRFLKAERRHQRCGTGYHGYKGRYSNG